MLDILFTNDEKKLYSEKRWKKIAKNDYVSYIDYHQNRLDSIKEHYKSAKIKNHKTEKEIESLQKFVDKINNFYYEVLIPKPNLNQNIYFEIEEEISQTLSDITKTFDNLQ